MTQLVNATPDPGASTGDRVNGVPRDGVQSELDVDAEEARQAVRRLRKRRNRRLIVLNAARLCLLAGILVAWEQLSGRDGKPLDQFYFSRPSLIWSTLREWQERGIILDAVRSTTRITVNGFLIGAALGLVAGLALGVGTWLSDIFRPFIDALYALPRLALMPLFIVWFGIGDGSKLALVVSVVFFLVFYPTYTGARDVDPQLKDRLRLMKASPLQVHRKVTVPAAMTFIVSGLSISAPYALVVAVTAEMFSSNEGLGFLLLNSSRQYNTAGVFASMALMMLLGICLTGLVKLLEARLLKWKRV